MALANPKTDITQLTKGHWHFVRELGHGGQGTVYKVRSKEAHERRTTLLNQIGGSIKGLAISISDPAEWTPKLVAALQDYLPDEPPTAFGALKVLRLKPDADKDQAQKAAKRFEAEVEALDRLKHPGIVRLLEADHDWMVTEFCDGDTLEHSSERFQGKPLDALRALRPLVEAVAALHQAEPRYIHRDIKPANIFVAKNGSLILGDFGIVFSEANRDRLTDTFERVGPRDWMAPWALTGVRIDEVKPTFDVFSLGKVLWCMVAGRHMLPHWYIDEPEYPQYNLTKLFPAVPQMESINAILRRCVVQHESACMATAGALLELVDTTLSMLEHDGEVLRLEGKRPCRVCGRGQYAFLPPDGSASSERVIAALRGDLFVPPRPFQPTPSVDPYFHLGEHAFWFRFFACNQCGHVQLFWCPDRKLLPAWESPRT